VAWYALAALAGIEGVWLALLAIRWHELEDEVRQLQHLLARGEEDHYSSHQPPP
jgi:hypothetical protein